MFYQDWLDCISTDHQVSAIECCSVWRKILKHWIGASGKIKWCLGRWPLRMPAYTSIVDIQLNAPNETFILDDLKLKELFMVASASPKFSWNTNPSDPNIHYENWFSPPYQEYQPSLFTYIVAPIVKDLRYSFPPYTPNISM